MPVACHHDNFDMYDSFHPWNSVDMGPRRDTLKEWKAAAHNMAQVRHFHAPVLVAQFLQCGPQVPDSRHAGGEAVQHGV